MVSFRFVLSRVCVFLYSLGPRTSVEETRVESSFKSLSSLYDCKSVLTETGLSFDSVGHEDASSPIVGKVKETSS